MIDFEKEFNEFITNSNVSGMSGKIVELAAQMQKLGARL